MRDVGGQHFDGDRVGEGVRVVRRARDAVDFDELLARSRAHSRRGRARQLGAVLQYGPIAIDPRDMQGVKSFQKIFLFDIELPEYIGLYNVGGRVYVRFDHGWEPLIWRWYRSARQLFLRRFNV